MCYIVTPLPTAFCHLDGSIYKTDKPTLAKALEKELQCPAYSPDIIEK